MDETLVYLDPSPRGEWALALAALLPAARRKRVCLLATAEDVAAHPDLVARARAALGPAGELRESVLPGPAERAVAGEARQRRFGLIVVPPAGRNALQRMLRGSRVATVVKSVHAPVLVARRPPARLERVLAAVSGRASTDAVAAAAEELASAALVRYVHVASEVALPHVSPANGPRDEGLARLRERLAAAGREQDLVLRDGLVVDEVLEEFEAGAYQLLVVGAQGEPGAGPDWLREDVTERLLLRCPASTLIVPTAQEGAPVS